MIYRRQAKINAGTSLKLTSFAFLENFNTIGEKSGKFVNLIMRCSLALAFAETTHQSAHESSLLEDSCASAEVMDRR